MSVEAEEGGRRPPNGLKLKWIGIGLLAVAAVAAAAWLWHQRPARHGMTYGEAARATDGKEQVFHADCATPGSMPRAVDGGCNTESGDTSCRARLPLLCTEPQPATGAPVVAEGPLKGWSTAKIGATRAVSGRDLTSREAAAGLCQSQIGSGWQPLERGHEQVQSVWSLRGERLDTPRPGQRYWVVSSDRPANCWDAAP